jgi:hypothetical protein
MNNAGYASHEVVRKSRVRSGFEFGDSERAWHESSSIQSMRQLKERGEF